MEDVRAIVCLAFRLLPRRARFRAAVVFARFARPLVARTRAWTNRKEFRTDGIAETSLELILAELTRRGVEYDPLIELDGAEYMPRPDDDRSCFLACAHQMLNVLIARHLYDQGIAFGAVIAKGGMRYPGTRVEVDGITPSDERVFEAWRYLRRKGGVLSSMIDRDGRSEPRTIAVEAANGTRFVSTALLQVAIRTKTRIVFFGTRLRGDRVVMTLRVAEETSVETLAPEFSRFVDQQLMVSPRRSRPRRSSDRTTATRG